MKYRVHILDTQTQAVVVEATSKEEAKKKVQAGLDSGDVWDKCEFEVERESDWELTGDVDEIE